ncbi:ABC transporter substrate-binding protein [Acidisoma cellulosilytica]|uniref:ABC transporter substrate-binding protein n=1 Tax=Acidisoma cellulosilyticum TaxID=2802395 RepID=A0A963Z781_9PROT|nr:ABC transporter substrate-binding protein [Acidisoma cellulosilyticum]MCB8883779.1 ABC transporter substrate-binding protein [Acidisoma cellulosilyticum]
MAANNDIVIGMAVALSGPVAAYDSDGAKMAQLFIDQTNAKGGLLGRQLRAVVVDTKSDRVEGARAGLAVLHKGASLVVVTCDYDYGAPAALQAQRAKTMSVFLCAEDPKAGVLGVGSLSFTSSIAAQVEGATMANWGYQKQKYRKSYVLLDDSAEYDKSVCAGFDWAFPKNGGQIVGRDTFKNADPSIASQITRLDRAIKEQGVDSVMLCTHTPGGTGVVRQLRDAGITLPIMNGSSMDGTYWLAAVPGLSDFYFAAIAAVADPRPAVQAMTADFKAKYGVPPASNAAYPIYSWLQLWAKAVTQVGSVDSKAVTAAMNSFRDEPTALGARSFTPKLHIQATAPMLVEDVRDGKDHVMEQWPAADPIPTSVLYRMEPK